MESAEFRATRWTVVLQAAQPDSSGGAQALADLCECYREALLRFARSWTRTHEDAEDLIQSFFCHLLEHNLPGKTNPHAGRFRTFLIACFKNFIRDDWRKRHRNRAIPAEWVRVIPRAALVPKQKGTEPFLNFSAAILSQPSKSSAGQ